ncbi:PE-PPE domain-containing protein [Mycobacterium sp.]|uniref:PE-PPE domain-containing protein n=2 Tax=Mycobacterium sp. TaxID=1785 RepID=UPI0031D73535
MKRALSPYVVASVAVAGLIAVPTVVAPNVQTRAVALMDNIAYVVGGSGDPIPSADEVTTNFDLFIKPLYPSYIAEALFTPEGNYALYTGVKSLTLDASEAQGAEILDKTITQQVAGGNDIVVKGASQSSTISGLVMSELAGHVSDSKLSFVLTGDPNLPNGGLFERLDGLTLPALGITFNGATPSDLFPTTIYTQEYDGFADVPKYPINLLSDINSVLGIQYVHPTYTTLTPDQIAPESESNPGGAILLPGSEDYGSGTADSMTNYYMIPTADLPLLDPLRSIPVVGAPLADLLQPDLTVLVNLGYDNPNPLEGWDAGPANVPTEFGLFPSLDQILGALRLLPSQTELGIQNFVGDLTGSGPNPVSLPSLSSLTALLDSSSGASSTLADPAALLSGLSLAGIASDLSNVVHALTAAVSTAYATVLPTADVVTTVLTAVPTYDFTLFAQGIDAGNLVEAIGQPIATDTYLLPLAVGFETFVVIDQASTVIGDLSGLLP